MTRILALDTATEACSCALNLDGRIIEDFAVMPRRHAQSILPMIRSLLQSQGLGFGDLDAIAWGRGPGSFTGLRIAAGVTQGIAFAARLPVVSVSTLAALALQHYSEHRHDHILACIDARIDEVYWACYRMQESEPRLIGDEQLTTPEQLPVEWMRLVFDGAGIAAAGNGLLYRARFPQELRERLIAEAPALLPAAGAIATLAAASFAHGEVVSAEAAQPLYLRDKVTHS